MDTEPPESPSSSSSPSATSYSPSQAVDVLSSLISFSHSIKVFPVKWQAIRHKLHELNASLLAILGNCDSDSNPILSAVLAGITATAGDCYDLAKRCADSSFSGKLLMQSDLDVLASRFERHLGNLSGICNSGVLTHRFAIVVSRPKVSTKEDMRFYAKDCLTRMKIGDSEMKKEAIVNLNEAVDEDEKYVRVIVELGEIVTNLVKLLDSDSSCSEIQYESAKLVLSIAGFDNYKQVLIGAGVIAPLVRILEGGEGEGSELGKKITSARCLMKLTHNSDNAWSVSAHGGVTALLKLCSESPALSAEMIAPATSILKNLAAVEEIKRFMLEDGAVSTFVKMVGSSTEEAVQVIAIDFLQFIASPDDAVSIIRAMVRVLDPNHPSQNPVASSSTRSREAALMAIENLCFNNAQNFINLLTRFKFVEFLLHHLRFSESSLKELSLKVSCRLAATSDDAKRAMSDAGFFPELVKFLAAKSSDVRKMAGEAIVALLSIPRNRKRFLSDEFSVGFVLELINKAEGEESETESSSSKFLVLILMAVANSNSWRRKIAGSGYLKSVEKLAESEGSEGKKLVKRLGSGRIRSMINGIIRH
ncbi:hypothetical protein LINGRAHAP2_LOCUS5394 [Linum grandiflorum]